MNYYLTRSNYLFKTSERYRYLLDNINAHIEQQFADEEKRNCIAASDVGLQVWQDLKALIKLIGANSLCDIYYETQYDLLYWACAFSATLLSASLKDKSYFEKRFAFDKAYVEMHKNF